MTSGWNKTRNLRQETNLLQKIAHHNYTHHPCPCQHQRSLFGKRTVTITDVKLSQFRLVRIPDLGHTILICSDIPKWTFLGTYHFAMIFQREFFKFREEDHQKQTNKHKQTLHFCSKFLVCS